MKTDKSHPMTKRLERKLLEFGVVMPEGATIHDANQELCRLIVESQKTDKKTPPNP